MRYFSPLWLDYSSGGLCRMIEERYELALDRIRLMQTEDTVERALQRLILRRWQSSCLCWTN